MSSKNRRKEPPVLSAAYLEKTSNKNELIRRLRNVTETLSAASEDDSLDPTTHPGLLSLSTALASTAVLEHADKSVRLHAVLALMEVFYIYAPEPPFEEAEILRIFGQMIRQLGNLYATPSTAANFELYYRILEQLSEVKIGVVLVDLIRTERDSGDADALESLCTLVRTLLTCSNGTRVASGDGTVHPPEVMGHAEAAVAACIEEFEGSVPIPVVEELLTCIGAGPKATVPNPEYARLVAEAGGSGSKGRKGKGGGKDGNKELPPKDVQVDNTSYLVAARIVRKTEDKISTPIANLLNGVLTGDPYVMERTGLCAADAESVEMDARAKSKANKGGKKGKGGKDRGGKKDSPDLVAHLEPHNPSKNVYSICFELHRIAPDVLTTVIGTVAGNLTNDDFVKRCQSTKLLGRLFGSRGSSIAVRFRPCFRDWLRRHADADENIRQIMVKSLVNFLMTQHKHADLCADVNDTLVKTLDDPCVDVRLAAIQQVCGLAHAALCVNAYSGAVEEKTGGDNDNNAGGSSARGSRRNSPPPISVVSAELLEAVGLKVRAKNKEEHRTAITGLAQIYFKHYLRPRLEYVQEGGDDVNIDEILQIWENVDSDLESKFGWIPRNVFLCVSYSDAEDAEMRSRIYQIVDDTLLGTAKREGSTLTPTARACGLAIILQSLKSNDNSMKWCAFLMSQRASLQRALGSYLDARTKAKECESGSPERYEADSDAMERLEIVAKHSAPVAPVKSPGKEKDANDLGAILKKVHGAKDKHIFRILSTIASPTHSPNARMRAFDELPKRTKGLGPGAQGWIRSLARRCAMGAFVNAEAIEHCIILSQECFESDDVRTAAYFLEGVKLATTIFPQLGGTKEGFKNLAEYFDAARTSNPSAKVKRDMEKFGLVTSLSEILARSGKSRSPAVAPGPANSQDSFDFGDGDGENSHDVLREQLVRMCTRDGTPEQARNGVYGLSSMIGDSKDVAARSKRERKEFDPLLKALVSPSRLAVPGDDVGPKAAGRIVSVLSAIAAVAECAPYAFNAPGASGRKGWGQKAVDFALEEVLLGRRSRRSDAHEDGGSDSEDGSDDDEEKSPSKKGRSKKKGQSRTANVHCKMTSGAIEVLVAHIRSTILHSRKGSKKSDCGLRAPSSAHTMEVFDTLANILRDDGVPPSGAATKHFKTAVDRAELRKAAAVGLLRLCDSTLKLEETHLTARMWHILGNTFLDPDKSVRESVMGELSSMLVASGRFQHNPPFPPSLRFVAYVSLCADGDSSGSAANAGAANVGKKSSSLRASATQCAVQLRSVCRQAQAQARAINRAAERKFEDNLKLKVMPEYSVPFALHLLAFREETGSAAGTLAGEDDDEDDVDEGELAAVQTAAQKMLRKRLKWLFDPLVQSLGSGADNISFLLRMVELIGKHPLINVLKSSNADVSALEESLDYSDDEGDNDDAINHVDEKEAAARMKVICQFAREVLLSHVKKDVNLTGYPGKISIPSDLFGMSDESPAKARYESDESDEDKPRRKRPKKSISHYVKENEEKGSGADDGHENEEERDESDEERLESPAKGESEEEDFGFGDVSPISKAEDKSPPPARKSKRGGSKAASSAKREGSAVRRSSRHGSQETTYAEESESEAEPSPPKGKRAARKSAASSKANRGKSPVRKMPPTPPDSDAEESESEAEPSPPKGKRAARKSAASSKANRGKSPVRKMPPTPDSDAEESESEAESSLPKDKRAVRKSSASSKANRGKSPVRKMPPASNSDADDSKFSPSPAKKALGHKPSRREVAESQGTRTSPRRTKADGNKEPSKSKKAGARKQEARVEVAQSNAKRSKAAGAKKRKKNEIEVYDEELPAAAAKRSRKSSDTKRSTTPTRAAKKKKSTPASVPIKEISVGTSSSNSATASSHKGELDLSDDDLNFSPSPKKAQAKRSKAKKPQTKKAHAKKAPAKKKTPSKVKISIGKPSSSTKSSSKKGGRKAGTSPSAVSASSSTAAAKPKMRRGGKKRAARA